MLVGGIIDKVNMPDRNTLLLLVHTRSGNFRLILSCDPSLPRAHLTVRKYKNPDAASGTLMFFRKRLVGAVFETIEKDKTERMVTFGFSARNELLQPVKYRLAVELTGKCANIIFIENGIIGNALRRVTSEAPGKRAVLTGLNYTPPTPTGRVPVTDRDAFKARVNGCKGATAHAAYDMCVAGLSRTTVDELFYRLKLKDDAPITDAYTDAFIDAAVAMYERPPSPVVTFDADGKPLDFFAEPFETCGGNAVAYSSVNAAMDAYYSALFDAAELAAAAKPLKAAVASAVKKNRKRLADAQATLIDAAGADEERKLGELITANIYKIGKGDTAVTVDDWYDGGARRTIALDPQKSASQNAARHFKAYGKKKKAAVYAEAALNAASAALDTLDGITAELALCTACNEIDEVRAELAELGLIRLESKKKKTASQPSEPYKFDIEGAVLYVGKNHAQNDRITRGADKTDFWLHVKDAHGSHAVLKTPHPSDSQIVRAAEIAAYYSQARGADKVAVDYTQIKHVHGKGGGHVEYTDYKTVFVKPKA